MNNAGIGTQIPTSTQIIIDAKTGINPLNAHKLAIKWATQTAKPLARTKMMRESLAEMLVENPDADDIQNLKNWIANN